MATQGQPITKSQQHFPRYKCLSYSQIIFLRCFHLFSIGVFPLVSVCDRHTPDYVVWRCLVQIECYSNKCLKSLLCLILSFNTMYKLVLKKNTLWENSLYVCISMTMVTTVMVILTTKPSCLWKSTLNLWRKSK